ncbi:MAG TPA: hypothetical protein VKJ65_06395 [Phycisphaerae bacterium]|nr:hypothetical protein [Phycisphaerae bacterium]
MEDLTNASETEAPEKSPSETDAEFEARATAAEAPKAAAKLTPRQEFQSWIDRNYKTISFPALAELEKLADDHLGKLPA